MFARPRTRAIEICGTSSPSSPRAKGRRLRFRAFVQVFSSAEVSGEGRPSAPSRRAGDRIGASLLEVGGRAPRASSSSTIRTVRGAIAAQLRAFALRVTPSTAGGFSLTVVH
jgi:hypothetical protein